MAKRKEEVVEDVVEDLAPVGETIEMTSMLGVVGQILIGQFLNRVSGQRMNETNISLLKVGFGEIWNEVHSFDPTEDDIDSLSLITLPQLDEILRGAGRLPKGYARLYDSVMQKLDNLMGA